MATLHIITPEYPPATGGVADYTHLIAQRLAEAGDVIHVWGPRTARRETNDAFEVHPEFGCFGANDLARVDQLLDEYSAPRRLLVQWVPHGYGFRAMNIRFCYWLWDRAQRGDQVELMVHEPYLAFWEGTWRQNAAAVVHRFMTVVLLRAATRVWVAIPAWETKWKPYTLGRSIPFAWLPISSALPTPDPEAVRDVRRQIGMSDRPIVGHLGTYGTLITSLLEEVLVELFRALPEPRVLLMGSNSETFCASFLRRHSSFAGRISSTGRLSDSALAAHIAACDVLVQPYPDGISSRRTTAMAGLHLGVPVVTTTGALTEPFWATSHAARLVPNGEWKALISHVDQLIQDSEERTRVTRNAKALYARMFDVDRTIRALRAAA